MYDKFVYADSKTKGTITCPAHGDFEQAPNSHMIGRGCPQCGDERSAASRRSNGGAFIAAATAVHPHGRYVYDKFVYTSGHSKGTITCNVHGDFMQTPTSHLSGRGCPECGRIRRAESKTLTWEEFVAQACVKHSVADYRYDKFAYTGARGKSTIICPRHGEFRQMACTHLKGAGCQKCGRESAVEARTLTLEGFIARARTVHPQANYIYGKTVYVNNHVKVVITCTIHGDFDQTPREHLSGCGCPPCGTARMADGCRSNLDKFVAEARRVHPHAGYGYDKAVYANAATKLIINCPIHGDFVQAPTCHLAGQGCQACGFERSASLRRSDLEEFIAKANDVHPSAGYGYNRFIYISSFAKGIIICQIHGDFKQRPAMHLAGQGCPQCGIERRAALRRSNLEEFVSKSKVVHPLADYTYGNFVYLNDFTKGAITCPRHGDFRQKPNTHLNGAGCPKCSGLVSRICMAWLDGLGVPVREYAIRLPARNRPVFADGYDPATNTIYEFLGDYFHGNPTKFAADAFDSKSRRTTYGEKHARWLCKQEQLLAAGYNVVSIWESDFKALHPRRVYPFDPKRTILSAAQSSPADRPLPSKK